MAVSLGPAAPAGKRPLDAELNLVPFIDLLVCCICFLLITAVWVHLSSVHARTGSGGGAGERTAVTKRLTVLVGSDGYTLSLGPERRVVTKKGSFYDDTTLARELQTLRAALDSPTLVVAGEDGVPVRQLIRAMDVAHGASFTEISMTDARGLL